MAADKRRRDRLQLRHPLAVILQPSPATYAHRASSGEAYIVLATLKGNLVAAREPRSASSTPSREACVLMITASIQGLTSATSTFALLLRLLARQQTNSRDEGEVHRSKLTATGPK